MTFSLKKYWSLALQENQLIRISRIARLGLQLIKDMIQETLIRLGLIDYNPKRLNSYLLESLAKKQASELLKDELRKHFYFNIEKREKILNALKKVAPEATGAIIAEADRICQHVFDLLGSGPTQLSEKIDWHTDFKTSHRWNPKTYYKRIRPAPYPGGYDIKVPWELSRCQHFVRLGQAYWINGEEKYAREFVAQVEDWIKSNPWPFGVNWACTMDVAIRVVNWLWGLAFFLDSPSLTDDFLLNLACSLLVHGRHIYRNLENRAGFTNNHYLADLVGLVYLGILCPEFKEAEDWKELGLSELWKEMFKQVYPDGVSFEGSIAYHRLATELFLSTVILCRLNRISVPDKVMTQLEKMLEFVIYYTKPDGTVPLIGDADNGRLHRLKIWDPPEREWIDHRYLLAIGAVFFERQDFGFMAGDQWEEALWLLGQKCMHHIRCASNRYCIDKTIAASGKFGNAGIYIMRSDSVHLLVELGKIGSNGYGTHNHYNPLGYELWMSGYNLIVDPGSYIYTSDWKSREWFRSIQAHNTIDVKRSSQSNISMDLFKIFPNYVTLDELWESKHNYDLLSLTRISHMPSGFFIQRRRVFFRKPESIILFCETMSSQTNYNYVLRLHLGINIVANWHSGSSRVLFYNEIGQVLAVLSLLSPLWEVAIGEGMVSKSYGIRYSGKTINFYCSSYSESKKILIYAIHPFYDLDTHFNDLLSTMKDKIVRD